MNRCKLLLVLCFVNYAWTQNDSIQINLSGYLDTYYAYNTSNPSEKTSPFLYSYNRQNTFALNVALLKADISYQNMYSRLSVQAGTYPTDNYASEPTSLLNEAFLGIKLNSKSSFEVGLFNSHIGFETATSHGNLTVTRSLVAESTPYYLTGIKYTYNPSNRWNMAVVISNGWQHIEKPNSKTLPALGTQIQYKISDSSLWNWSTFWGDEFVNGSIVPRVFNNLFWDKNWSQTFRSIIGFDMGFQKQNECYVHWLAPVGVLQYRGIKHVHVSYRTEYFEDLDNTMFSLPNSGKVYSQSVNVDYLYRSKTKLRLETRYFKSPYAIFESRTSALILTVSMSFEW